MNHDDRRDPLANQVPCVNGRRESDRTASELHGGTVWPDTAVQIMQRAPFVVYHRPTDQGLGK